MSLDIVTCKTHAWAAQRFGIDASTIESVEFTVFNGGYCETCSYETCGVEIRFCKDGRSCWETFEVGDLNVAQVVREISAMEVE